VREAFRGGRVSYYSRVSFKVIGLSDDEVEQVKAILDEESIDEVSTDMGGASSDHEVYGDGDICLGANEDESAWTRRVTKKVWEHLRRPAEVHADWWYERDADETIILGDDEFNEMFPALSQLAMTADEEDKD